MCRSEVRPRALGTYMEEVLHALPKSESFQLEGGDCKRFKSTVLGRSWGVLHTGKEVFIDFVGEFVEACDWKFSFCWE